MSESFSKMGRRGSLIIVSIVHAVVIIPGSSSSTASNYEASNPINGFFMTRPISPLKIQIGLPPLDNIKVKKKGDGSVFCNSN